MTLFSSPKESYLGIDIGTASIKVVQLEPFNNRPRLITYGYADIATDIVHSRTQENQQKIFESLKKVLDIAKVSTHLVNAALPTFSVFNSIISLPPMSGKDLASAVKWEAKKYVPLPLEEMILDWQMIKETESNIITPQLRDKKMPAAGEKSFFSFLKGEKKAIKPAAVKKNKDSDNKNLNIRVLVTAAPKTLVSRYLAIFQAAGLKLLSLETEAFALSRSLIGQDKSTIMIVDLGSITTDICLIEQGVPVLNRSIDLGGLTITKAIASSLNINLERAEQFKRDFGISLNQQETQKGINKTIATAIGPILNEIKYVFDLYQAQVGANVEKIILAGGSALLNNFDHYLEQLFNKPTVIGNPWDRVVYPVELKPVLDEVGSRLAVSIGLAMRDIK